MNSSILKEPVRQIIELLVRQQFSELESLTHGIRLSAQQMAGVITMYNRKLTLPPDDAYKAMDIVKVQNAEPPKWSVIMPLWTKEEGRSDLSIELTIIEEHGSFQIELDDIHVL